MSMPIDPEKITSPPGESGSVPALDLAMIEAKWLRQCGACDVGMPEYGCNHPTEDYRPVMLSLVREVERLREQVSLLGVHLQRDATSLVDHLRRDHALAADRENLCERLAAVEHQRWADWQRYVHGLCQPTADGSLVIPAALVARWERQMATPYEQLSEAEKCSDREQVGRYWSLLTDRVPAGEPS